MGMYDAAQRHLGRGTEHAEKKPAEGPQTELGSSGEQEEPGKADGNEVGVVALHRRAAAHHKARAAYHERLSKLHDGQAAHHHDEAAWHEGEAGEYK